MRELRADTFSLLSWERIYATMTAYVNTEKNKFYVFLIVPRRTRNRLEAAKEKVMKKERSPDQTLGQVSLPKDLLCKSKAYAKRKGLPWATWVRTLIITELDKEASKDKDSSGHFIAPAALRGRSAGASGSFLRR